MSWRLHLTNQTIGRLSILQRKQMVIAAYPQAHEVYFYHYANGAYLGKFQAPPYDGQTWHSLREGLCDPFEQALPRLAVPPLGEILQMADGHWALRLERGAVHLYEQAENAPRLLYRALDFAPQTGVWAFLDVQGYLHLYDQARFISQSSAPLFEELGATLELCIARDGRGFASDGQTLVAWDKQGQVLRRLPLYYPIGHLACTPNAGLLATSDRETGVLRLYRGDTLHLTHQKFAIELVVKANPVQLLEELPPPTSAISALALTPHGDIAFAMAGVICTSSASYMDELPSFPKR